MSSNVYNIDDRRHRPNAERPLSETLNEAKSEFKAFFETRVAMLRSEMKDKMTQVKVAAPLMLVGAIFGVTAWLVLTGALVAVISVAFQGTAFGPFIALVIVGVTYAIVAGLAMWMGYGRLTAQSLMPERTMTVLKEDKVWLQNEARTQL
jgi:mannose/fructose/N-acetylgalactosamine-specific phosphotransferase system component IID